MLMFSTNLPPPHPPPLTTRQAEALRKELTAVKDKAKAYIGRLNEVSGAALHERTRPIVSLLPLLLLLLPVTRSTRDRNLVKMTARELAIRPRQQVGAARAQRTPLLYNPQTTSS